VGEIVSTTTPVKEDYRDAVAYLNAHAMPQDIAVVSAPFTIYPVEYYYRASAPLATLPVWDRYTFGPIPAFAENDLPAEVSSLADNHQNLWLLLSYNQGYEDKIRLYFDTHYKRISVTNFSSNLTLYEYKLRYE
jgi:mannosyltransferase